MYCLNPTCPAPANNTPRLKRCRACRSKLLIAKRYRALEPIASGGFGRTFLAQDERDPQKARCAIKQFYPERLDLRQADKAQAAVALFHAEADRLAQLGSHPQIPVLLAHAEQENYQYIVQEFIDGPNLAEELAAVGPFTEDRIRELLASLLSVLDFVHHGRVIHRDIKPANIIRRRDTGDLVLVDFGAAKYATETSLAQTGTLIGSAGYAAPEQLFGKPTYASDLYSLGVTCIHLLTQTDPFELYEPAAGCFTWRDYLGDNPVSDRLGRVLDRAVASSVGDRFRSAREMLQALAGSAPLPGRTARILPLQLRGPLRVRSLAGLRETVRALAFSPDGRLLAASSQTEGGFLLGKNAIVRLFETEGSETDGSDRQTCFVQRPGNWILSLAFSPDGRYIAGGGQDGSICLWNLDSRQRAGTLSDRSGPVRAIAWSPDGAKLVSVGEVGPLHIWEMQESSQFSLARTLPAGAARTLAISPDGQILATDGPERTIELWDLTLGVPLPPLKGHQDRVEALAFGPDGQLLASSSGDWERHIRLWDVPTAETVATWQDCGAARSLQFSPDGRLLLTGGGDRFVRLWDVAGNRLLRLLRGHQALVCCTVFCPSGRRFASGGARATLKLWSDLNYI